MVRRTEQLSPLRNGSFTDGGKAMACARARESNFSTLNEVLLEERREACR